MATAGDRYNEITGNIWSYSKRGDMTGVKAALLRNVDVNVSNTAGWTPLHAAAAGGQLHVVRALLRGGANMDIRDKGGNLAVHEAARGGHLQCLEALRDAGVDLSQVRLSQTKGAAVRALVADATRKASVPDDEIEQANLSAPVGYARQKTKSTAFWGPRRTPISSKIKKEILQEKRKRRGADGVAEVSRETEETNKDASETTDVAVGPRTEHAVDTLAIDTVEAAARVTKQGPVTPPVASYVETVKLVKKTARARRSARKAGADKDHESQIQHSDDVCDQICSQTSASDDTSASPVRVVKGFAALVEHSGSDSSRESTPRLQ